jgi:hypothetical protein
MADRGIAHEKDCPLDPCVCLRGFLDRPAEVVDIDSPRCPIHKVGLVYDESDEPNDDGWYCPTDGCLIYIQNERGSW